MFPISGGTEFFAVTYYPIVGGVEMGSREKAWLRKDSKSGLLFGRTTILETELRRAEYHESFSP